MEDSQPIKASSSSTSSSINTAKPVLRGKGKALNAIAAASGRDPAAIVAATAAARARRKEEEEEEEEADEEGKEEGAKSIKKIRDVATVNAPNNDDNSNDDEEDPSLIRSRLYNELSEHDQYRFECFRRCGFPSRPMESFIAKTLIEEAEKRIAVREGWTNYCTNSKAASTDITSVNASSNKRTNDEKMIHAGRTTRSSGNKPKKRQGSRSSSSVMQMLQDEFKRRKVVMDQPFPYKKNHVDDDSSTTPTPALKDLVVSSAASEIVAVVSALAKCYAQRLVAAARRVADAEIANEKERVIVVTPYSSSSSVEETTTNVSMQPLKPQHLLDAYTHRVRAGIDPGFWMSSQTKTTNQCERHLGSSKRGVGTIEAAAVGTLDRDQACYLAALAAQDRYDEEFASGVDDNETLYECSMGCEIMNIDETEDSSTSVTTS